MRRVKYLIPKYIRMRVQAQKKKVYKKSDWVVGNCQFLRFSSSVVTFVHVMHSEAIWPNKRESMKVLVHKLRKRRHELWKKAPTEE